MLLSSILLLAGCWCWDSVVIPPEDPPIDGYNLRWSEAPTTWCADDYLAVITNQIDACNESGPESFCTLTDIPDPPIDTVTFVMITAWRGTQESELEEGRTIEACP